MGLVPATWPALVVLPYAKLSILESAGFKPIPVSKPGMRGLNLSFIVIDELVTSSAIE
jgi:hypothetical protein